MRGRGTTDANATLKIALQELKNANYDAYVLFVDLVKAFDTVNRELIFELLPLYTVRRPKRDDKRNQEALQECCVHHYFW
jgi:hypothetical protein